MPTCTPLKYKLGDCSPRIVSADFLVTQTPQSASSVDMASLPSLQEASGIVCTTLSTRTFLAEVGERTERERRERKGGGEGCAWRLWLQLLAHESPLQVAKLSYLPKCNGEGREAEIAEETVLNTVSSGGSRAVMHSWRSANGHLLGEEPRKKWNVVQAATSRRLQSTLAKCSGRSSGGTRRPKSWSAVAPRCTT